MKPLFYFFSFFSILFFIACKEDPVATPKKRKYAGSVELYNSCGITNAAAKMTSFLRKNGFDVVSTKNDLLQNYKETIIAIRNPQWEGAEALAKLLQTENILQLKNELSLIDVTVYIGKDFNKIIEQELP